MIEAIAMVGAKLLQAAFTRKFLMTMVILGGDYFVNKTETDVDNKAWAAFKQSLNEMESKGR